MKISVVIPAYNSERFLAETLDCLLGQTLKDIQIITVNDGSTDSTADIIAEYAAKHPNILPVYQENAGVSAARNNGISRAEGKYTMFVDSDDLLSPDALEVIYNSLEENSADLAICRSMRFGYGGEEYNPIVDSLAKEKDIDCFDKRLLWNFLISNKCFKTELLKKSGVIFPHLRYSEDGAFTMQFIYAARPKITGAYGAVFKYRRHTPSEGFSVSQSISGELVSHFLQSLDIVYKAAEKATVDEDYLQEILCKTYFALINEFYRILWRADNETLKFIGKNCRELKSRMTAEAFKKCANAQKDLGDPLFDRNEIAEKPFVSVIAKDCSEEFIGSLYAQSMPIFELITASKNTPDCENITVISPKSFKKAAKKAAKGKIAVVLNGKKPLDSRFLKVVSLLKRSPKFGIFPNFVIKFGAMLFLKIKK